MTLILAALLSSAATVRESQCLTAMVRIGRDWLGGAFCNLGLVPLKCGAGSCFALCLGACTPGEGCPVARPCAARGHFCKRHDPADLLQLRSCILLHLVSFPKVLYTQLSKWGQKGVLICQSNRSDDDSQRIFSHQDNTWFVWGNISSTILSKNLSPTLFLSLVTAKLAPLLPSLLQTSTTVVVQSIQSMAAGMGALGWTLSFSLQGEGGGVPQELKCHLSPLHHPQ